jgi:hypothetical protein
MSFAYPIDEHRYREQTARQRSHPGVTRRPSGALPVVARQP